jgi:hypothetical protein
MRETDVKELRRELAGKMLKVHLDGRDVTENCIAFDTDGGWVEISEQGNTVRKYGKVTVIQQTA